MSLAPSVPHQGFWQGATVRRSNTPCCTPAALLGARKAGTPQLKRRRCCAPAASALPHLGEEGAARVIQAFTRFGSIGGDELPLVYSPLYNIRFLGIEKLHPFDSCKYGKVVSGLAEMGLVEPNRLAVPTEATEGQLLDVHTAEYLTSLRSARTVAEVAELAPLAYLPGPLVDARVLRPMRLMCSGTVLATGLALLRGGVAINLGGGFHHASAGAGGGWCAYADLHMAARVARSTGLVRRVLVVDLDAHQGNGVSRDKLARGDLDMFIVDAFREGIYPLDAEAEEGVDIAVRISKDTGDEEYLERVRAALDQSLSSFGTPDLILYNAGTDILQGDPLGGTAVTAEGVRRRDEAVVGFARACGAPVAMALSGGYTRESAGVITESVGGLLREYGV